MDFSVDPFDVLVPLLRDGLGAGYQVRTRAPSNVADLVPLVLLRQTGGSSPAPDFYDQPYISVVNWATGSADEDAVDIARRDADRVRELIWTAWRSQTVTAAGHLVWVRESQGPMEINDPDLPHLGCFTATYEIRIRRALSA